MLQWMGGSRRKVTTSRKSTQKRQKQYFEQRKRQQRHRTAGLESYTDGVSESGQHNKEHRSLDVLSLLNLSTVAQECKTNNPCGETSEVNTTTVDYQVKKCPSTILTNGATPADYVEVNRRTPSGYQVEILSQNSDSERHKNAFNGKGDKLDNWKTAKEHQLSVFDLLGDDGPCCNSEDSPVHEAHVAFSVEGLGKVGTETPVHSPQQPHRFFSHGCSSSLKAARKLHSSKKLDFMVDDLEVQVDAMMEDNMSPRRELPFYSMGMVDPSSNPKHRVSTFRDFMHHGGCSGRIRSSFGDEIFYDIKDKNEDKWNARFCFPDESFLDDRECDIYWKNWPHQMDDTSAGFLKNRNHELLDFESEGPYISKKRNAMKARDRFNNSGSLSPYLRCQTSENDHDFANPDGTRSPILGKIWGSTGITKQPDWPSFATEDARDSLSLLSEESCSSSAVISEATYNPPSNSMARKSIRRHGNNFCSQVSNCSLKNTHARETWHKNRDDAAPRGNYVNESGEFARKSSRSRSKPANCSKAAFLETIGPNENWLLDEGYNSTDINPDFSSLFQIPETKHHSSGFKLWTEALADLSPKMEGMHPDSFRTAGSLGGGEFPDTTMDGSVRKWEENTSSIQPTDHQKFEPERENWDGKEMDASDSKEAEEDSGCKEAEDEEEDSGCKEAEDENPETVATNSPYHVEESSSVVSIPHKSDGSKEEEKGGDRDDAHLQLPLACLNGNKANKGTEDRVVLRKEENKCVERGDPSCQVMMFESYVLQLLCVQKMLKDASAADSGNKISPE